MKKNPETSFLWLQLKKNYRKLLLLINKVKKNRNKKNVHLLRLNLKTWQSFFDFITFFNTDKTTAIKFPRSWSVFFAALGKLRETQLIINQCKTLKSRFPVVCIFNRYLIRKKKKYQYQLRKLLGKMDFSCGKKIITSAEKLVVGTNNNKLKAGIHQFLRAHLLWWERINGSKRLYMLHWKRIHVKRVTQFYSFYPQLKTSSINDRVFRHLRSLEKLLGKWHDALVIRKRFARFLVKKKLEFKLNSVSEFQHYLALRELRFRQKAVVFIRHTAHQNIYSVLASTI